MYVAMYAINKITLRIMKLKGVGNYHSNNKLIFYIPFKNQVPHNVNQSLFIVAIVVNAK